MPAATSPEVTLIDQLLAEQGTLQTPVAQAADFIDRAPHLAENFKTLIPLTKPAEGEQYAFQVELDRCTGCKACVSACHSLNGLDEEETWRDVGNYVGSGISQTVTTACHHCESPECLHGCPVAAYDKDEQTGIVRHLDDQCIGCSYCILKCPFDVPKYSKKRGIVRKCDMCHDRLAEGEAPACVQACPTQAIKIVTVPNQTQPNALFTDLNKFTRPKTQYLNPPAPLSAARRPLRAEHAHAPLVFMLTLTQIGAGLLLLPVFFAEKFLPSAFGTLLIFIGLGIGSLHLGQPLKVWRFFLGLKTSWLSREFAVFGALTALAPALVIATSPWTPSYPFKDITISLLSIGCALTALGAVFTSVMLYADTRRQLWSLRRSAFRFYTTVTTAAFAAAAALATSPSLAVAASLILVIKAISEIRFTKLASNADAAPDQFSARLITGPLRKIYSARLATLAVAVVMLPIVPILGLALVAATELLERTLFFTSVYAPKMV